MYLPTRPVDHQASSGLCQRPLRLPLPPAGCVAPHLAEHIACLLQQHRCGQLTATRASGRWPELRICAVPKPSEVDRMKTGVHAEMGPSK